MVYFLSPITLHLVYVGNSQNRKKRREKGRGIQSNQKDRMRDYEQSPAPRDRLGSSRAGILTHPVDNWDAQFYICHRCDSFFFAFPIWRTHKRNLSQVKVLFFLYYREKFLLYLGNPNCYVLLVHILRY